MTTIERILNYILFPIVLVMSIILCVYLFSVDSGARIFATIMLIAIIAMTVLTMPKAIRNIRYPFRCQENDNHMLKHMNWKDFHIISTTVDKLIAGKMRNIEDTRETLLRIGCRFRSEFFAVVAVDVVDIFDRPEEVLRELLSDDTHLLSAHISRLFLEGMPGNIWKHFITGDEGSFVCLLNIEFDKNDQEKTLFWDRLRADLLEITRKAEVEYGYKIRVTVSRAVLGIGNIDLAYEEAVRLLDIVENDCGVKMGEFSKEISTSESDDKWNKDERFFANYVLSRDFDNAKEKIERLIEGCTASLYGLSMAKNIAKNRINWILAVVDIDDGTRSNERIRKCLKQIQEAQTISEVKLQTCTIFDELKQAAGDIPEISNAKIDAVKQYILENYHSPDMNVSSVCHHFKMTVPYLSHQFKMYTDVGMLEFINRLRIEEAKKLLRETTMRINDIVVEVGYSNSWTMIRTFKRIEGVTPSEYRTIYKIS